MPQPKRETRYQRLLRLKEEGKVGLLPRENQTHPCPCPKRGGPAHPHPDRPGMVGFGTCRGCKYHQGIFFAIHVCSHPQAQQIAAQHHADSIRRWEEQQSQQTQLTLL